MVGKEVEVFNSILGGYVVGIVESEGIFPDSYVINLGNLYLHLYGNEYDNKIVALKDYINVLN